MLHIYATRRALHLLIFQNLKGTDKILFEEFSEYEGQCRFNGCVHINEPDCRVKEAVEAGLISRRRYTSYVEIYDEVKNKKKY